MTALRSDRFDAQASTAGEALLLRRLSEEAGTNRTGGDIRRSLRWFATAVATKVAVTVVSWVLGWILSIAMLCLLLSWAVSGSALESFIGVGGGFMTLLGKLVDRLTVYAGVLIVAGVPITMFVAGRLRRRYGPLFPILAALVLGNKMPAARLWWHEYSQRGQWGFICVMISCGAVVGILGEALSEYWSSPPSSALAWIASKALLWLLVAILLPMLAYGLFAMLGELWVLACMLNGTQSRWAERYFRH